ncbi:MAG: AI-2E family transporter [Eubacteriales bacterium]
MEKKNKMKEEHKKRLEVITMKKALLNILVAIIIIVGFVLVLPWVVSFFRPLLIGGLIAFCSNPLVKLLEKLLKIKHKLGTVIFSLIAITIVCFISYGIYTLLRNQAIGFIGSIPAILDDIQATLVTTSQNMDGILGKILVVIQELLQDLNQNVDQYLGDLITLLSAPTIEAVGSFAKTLPSMMVNGIMGGLLAYFFILDREFIDLFMKSHVPKEVREYTNFVYHNLIGALVDYLKAQCKIELFMYFFLLIGLLLIGTPYAALIALGIACLDILPFFGTGIILLPWALMDFISGDYKKCIGLLIIWGVGQLIRQIIQPKIVGDTIGVSPIPTIILLYMGYHMYGVMGMVLALPFGIIIIKLNREGIFDQTVQSLRLFVKLFNEMRRLEKEDLSFLENDHQE